MKKQGQTPWGDDTCPKCEGIQVEERNCAGITYRRWRCCNCGDTEGYVEKKVRLEMTSLAPTLVKKEE